VLRYSLALAQRREMGTVTLDDAAVDRTRAQVMIIVGIGVPLSVEGVRSPEGILDRADTGGEIDQRTEGLTAARNVVADPDRGIDDLSDFGLGIETF
jgi:hypothetical protein